MLDLIPPLYLNYVSLLPLTFCAWRAGFRGYGLCKYNRGRLLTLALSLTYPCYGPFAISIWAENGLLKPFREENPWHHGLRFALTNQVGMFITTTGNIGLAYLFAVKSGLIIMPPGIQNPTLRQITVKVVLNRVKPYVKSIALSAAFSTTVMFAIGYGAYQQSCYLLAKLDRKSLVYKEA